MTNEVHYIWPVFPFDSLSFRKLDYVITASLDSIDSSLGYTIDNIQWIHKQINIMKNVYSNSDLIDICYKIVETDVNKRLKKSGSQG